LQPYLARVRYFGCNHRFGPARRPAGEEIMSRHATRSIVTILAILALSAGLAAMAAPVWKERTLELQPGGRFDLDTDLGAVVVTGTSGSGAKITIRSSRSDLDEYLDIDFQESAGEVRVRARKPKGMSGWFKSWKGGSVQWEIEVPARTELSIDTAGGSIEVTGVDAPASLDTSGGGIRVDDLGGELHADTSGGSIRVSSIRGNATLDTSGGGITATEVDGSVVADTSGGGIRLEAIRGDIDADTSGGGIEIEEAGGRVRADTSGGPISVTFASGNAAGGHLSTSGGGVRVWVDPTAALDIDASTSGGSVRCEIPITVQGKIGKSSLQGKINGGGNDLVLRSSGGGITIDAR
jgi:DUF4097 and DUF4098 domain-containing protein YvlB